MDNLESFLGGVNFQFFLHSCLYFIYRWAVMPTDLFCREFSILAEVGRTSGNLVTNVC